MSQQETKARPMLVSERLEMRLLGSPEQDNDQGYTMYPNWQLRMEIADAKDLEAKLSKMDELKTYAMLLEGKVPLDLTGWLLNTRRLLGLEKEMTNWLIPDEHREALAGDE